VRQYQYVQANKTDQYVKIAVDAACTGRIDDCTFDCQIMPEYIGIFAKVFRVNDNPAELMSWRVIQRHGPRRVDYKQQP